MRLKEADRSVWRVAGCCEYGNESLGSIKCRVFLDLLRKCQLLKGCLIEVTCAN